MEAILIFALTYAGVAIGRIPGLQLDRTGIALLGAIAMVVSGAVPLGEAVGSIDIPTILLLYALMIISAQLRLGGFYTRIALYMTRLCVHPRQFLMAIMGVGAVLSALLANDIICLAFTPVLAYALLAARMNPVPFLLALAVAANIGSAATIIGNPQNMLIGQVGQLPFAGFLLWCSPPVIVSLIGSYFIIVRIYGGRWHLAPGARPTAEQPDWPPFNAWQSAKGLAAVVLLVILFFTDFHRELAALGIAGVLLCSRKMKSRRMIELVDWHLLTLFCALFVVIEGISAARLPQELMALLSGHQIDIRHPIVLIGVSTLLSNLVSNVPAVMLLVQFLAGTPEHLWYLLALSSTFAGNLITIGSIANLIVIEQARVFGITIGFKTHAQVGVAVTAWSLVALAGWIYW